MKRKLTLVIVLLMIVLLSACNEPTTYTDQTEDYVYSVGEEISVYDNESSSLLGTVTVTGVSVVKSDAFTIKQVVDYDEDGDEIYKDVPYEAVVQIDYQFDVADSTNKITQYNFAVTDCEGNSTVRSPDVDYVPIDSDDESMFFAVKNKGEFVNISFAFHRSQRSIAEIKAVYDGSSIVPGAAAKPSKPDKHVEFEDDYEIDYGAEPVIMFIALIVIMVYMVSPYAVIGLVIVVIFLSSKNKHLKETIKLMQNGAHIPPQQGNYYAPGYPPQPYYPYPTQYPPVPRNYQQPTPPTQAPNNPPTEENKQSAEENANN